LNAAKRKPLSLSSKFSVFLLVSVDDKEMLPYIFEQFMRYFNIFLAAQFF